MSASALSVLEAVAAPEIWRRWFRDPAGWRPWRGFLAALFGLPSFSRSARAAVSPMAVTTRDGSSSGAAARLSSPHKINRLHPPRGPKIATSRRQSAKSG
jgi:hypothetical protein